MKVKVRIKKLAGETGLLVPGTLTEMEESKAKRLKKFLTIIRPKKKKAKTTKK